MISALSVVSELDAGLAGGLITTTQQIGMALGLAILIPFADRVAGGPGTTMDPAAPYRAAFLAATGIAIVTLIVASVLLSRRESRAHARAAQRIEQSPAWTS